MNNSQTQAQVLPVIITLSDAKASVVCHPQNISVILIDLDELNETSNSDLALTLIDTVRAAHLHPDQLETLVKQITEAAQYICTRCGTPIPLGKDQSTPSGSMHDDCAHEYEQQSPQEF
jgi:RNA polymerase-binding transcription factor DksA